MRSFIGAVGGNADVDFMDENYNTAHSASYEGVSPARVLSGITSFYDEGIKPKGNVSYSVDRLSKRTVEKGFGGIWIADKQEFAKFASAVKTTPHEEDGEGIAFTDNYFYAYYRNIDGQPIPYASVYMNRFESQDVVNVIREARKNGEKKGNREIIDLAYGLARNANRKNDADISDNKSASTTRGNGRVGRKLSRFGKYYYSPSLYVKTQRADIKDYDEIDNTNYSLNRTDIDYLDAVNRGDIEAERADIENKAKTDGTWLKAPNGKDTNLSSEQWVSVRTKAFKEWFGDWENDPENASKVVDENGEPLVVYHFTPAEFTIFNYDNFGKGNDGGNSGKGFYFTPEEDSIFRGNARKKMDCFLNIRNPFINDWSDFETSVLALTFNRTVDETIELLTSEKNDGADKEAIAEAVAALKKLSQSDLDTLDKVDGVITWTAPGDYIFEYVVKEPNQIKSATENIGTFDSANDDIRYSLNLDEFRDSQSEEALSTEEYAQVEAEATLVNTFTKVCHQTQKSLQILQAVSTKTKEQHLYCSERKGRD